MDENILIADWKGIMAHFRQFDANSSSLSYSFPPPTVIAGMVAGLLGIEKDHYYKLFNKERLKVAVQIKTPPRKIMQTVNYIFAKSPGDLNMSGDNLHTQIPSEFLVSRYFPKSPLIYRLILRFADLDIFQEVARILQSVEYKYLPYLGSAPFNSWLEWIGTPEKIELLKPGSEYIVDTVIPTQAVEPQSLRLDPLDGKTPAYFREHVRREFLPNREPGEIMNVIWERNRGKIWAKFNSPVHRLTVNSEELSVIFL